MEVRVQESALDSTRTTPVVPRDEERAVVERIRRGDRAAFAILYRWYATNFRVILSRLPTRDRAEDCLRDTFRTVLEKIERFEYADRSIFYWIRRIAVNKAMDATGVTSATAPWPTVCRPSPTSAPLPPRDPTAARGRRHRTRCRIVAVTDEPALRTHPAATPDRRTLSTRMRRASASPSLTSTSSSTAPPRHFARSTPHERGQASSALGRWLDSGGQGHAPEGIDADVLEAIYAIKPELAPPASVSIDDILGDVTEGPFAQDTTPVGGEVVPFPVPTSRPHDDVVDEGASAPDETITKGPWWIRWGTGGVAGSLQQRPPSCWWSPAATPPWPPLTRPSPPKRWPRLRPKRWPRLRAAPSLRGLPKRRRRLIGTHDTRERQEGDSSPPRDSGCAGPREQEGTAHA